MCMLRSCRWEYKKQKLQHYKRRSQEGSVLYQIVYYGHEELQRAWETKFQHLYRCLRDEVSKTPTECLECGPLGHGAARLFCNSCKHSLLIAFSCKCRLACPSCGAKRAVNFSEHIYSEVIKDVPHRHSVFTIPNRLRGLFNYYRKLNTILIRGVWGALSQVLRLDERELTAIFTLPRFIDATVAIAEFPYYYPFSPPPEVS